MMNDPAVLGCGLNESKKTTNLGGGNSIFFTPNLGEIIQSDEHIFEMGWFNHQLECKQLQQPNQMFRKRMKEY